MNAPKPYGKSNPNYSQNLSVASRKHGDDVSCCCLCGKFAGKNPRFVAMTDMNEYTTRAQLKDDDIGMAQVGTDCAKTLKDAGVAVYVFSAVTQVYVQMK